MEGSSDRRTFFKQLLRGAAQTAAEVSEALKGAQLPETQEPDQWQVSWSGASLEGRPVPAAAGTHVASDDELRALASEAGLEARIADVLAQARRSVRLTRGDVAGRSHLGGAPDLPAGFEWPHGRDDDLAFLAQVALDEVAALDLSLPLPASGLLLLFYDLERRPNGLRPDDGVGTRVVHVEGELEPAPPERAALPELPLALSGEVTLPGESAGLPASLALDADELDPWQRLRERLAELQGLEVEDRAVDWHALHRLLGHPDTTDEGMQLDAQLVSNGIDLNTGERYFDPRAAELEPGADDWRLLFQLSSDGELDLSLGYPPGRLFVWIRQEDLVEGRFDRIWAFVR
jgi:uncharacterized protein YwqG